jgi:hypothetical protein
MEKSSFGIATTQVTFQGHVDVSGLKWSRKAGFDTALIYQFFNLPLPDFFSISIEQISVSLSSNCRL